jgi:ankyrin repeat protein
MNSATLQLFFLMGDGANYRESPEQIKQLIKDGADVNVCDHRTNSTYVQKICMKYKNLQESVYEDLQQLVLLQQIFRLFVQSDAFDVNHANTYGYSLIHIASQMHCEVFLRDLLHYQRSKIKNINVPWTYIRENVLHISCIGKNATASKVQILIENGADPTLLNNEGLAAIHLIIVNKRCSNIKEKCAIIEILCQSGMDPDICCFFGPTDEKGYSPIPKRDRMIGFTPLHVAIVKSANIQICRKLLEMGCNPLKETADGARLNAYTLPTKIKMADLFRPTKLQLRDRQQRTIQTIMSLNSRLRDDNDLTQYIIQNYI